MDLAVWVVSATPITAGPRALNVSGSHPRSPAHAARFTRNREEPPRRPPDADYTYDPSGEVTVTNPTPTSNAQRVNPFRYAGGTYDISSNLIKFGQRWYDPDTARFTQMDSLETLADPSRANRYEYANGSPVNYVDPTGKITFVEGAIFALGVVSVATGIGAAAAITVSATYALTTTSIVTGLASTVFGAACLFNDEDNEDC